MVTNKIVSTSGIFNYANAIQLNDKSQRLHIKFDNLFWGSFWRILLMRNFREFIAIELFLSNDQIYIQEYWFLVMSRFT